jgi:small subunit ribosomal protein S9
MADEEKQEETSEEPQPVGETQAEGTQVEETETEEAESSEDTPADPGREAEESAVDGEGGEDPEASEVTEAGSPEPEEAADAKRSKPAEGKKDKDVIPGADLEPIAVEQADEQLSAEERARREAEEEERAQREAELVGEGAEEEPQPASRAPAKLESGSRFQATGKRKRSIARVILLPGSGKIEINDRSLEEFFPRPLHQTMARQPLATTGYEGSVDVRVRVHGGGIGGQAGAVRHGISRALTEIDPELRGELKRRGFLTRDARVKERRKAGLKKARKRPQFSKR